MTTPTQPNGNGTTYSTKELLARIEAKLDLLTQRLETVTLDMAVHEAKPFHDAARGEMDEIRRGLESNRTRLAAYAGGIAVAVFVVELVARILG